MNERVLDVRRVSKHFDTPAGSFVALRDVSLTATRGELLAIVGHSGSGKSTLMGLLAGLDRPSAGEVHVAGAPVHALGQRALTAWRGRTVGVVFQFFQLLPTLTALENVMLPMDLCGTWHAAERRERARALLARLGVEPQAAKLPATLSGGQQQRVAIARALANAPAVLLADEPTGNLDSATARAVFDVLAELAAAGQTVVLVTHDADAGRIASRTVELVDGRVAAEVVQHA